MNSNSSGSPIDTYLAALPRQQRSALEKQTITMTLSDANGGTELHAVHDNLPAGIAPSDNDIGWRISLGKLAALVETGDPL
jgi:hypothetical protein